MKKSGKSNKTSKVRRSADTLAKTGKKTGVELNEQELDKVSGGPTAVELKID